nr:type II toxin-antitoxin system HicB family antitoxin [uncultured Celeribacter sp.]
MNDLKYKGYVGSADVDYEDDVLCGKLLFIKDLVTYEAETPQGLKQAFQEAVDDYLADCAEQGVDPDEPFKGSFNVRVSSDLHRKLALCARAKGKAMNEYIGDVLKCHDEIGDNGQVRPRVEHKFVVISSPSEKRMAASSAKGQVVSKQENGKSSWYVSESTNAIN